MLVLHIPCRGLDSAARGRLATVVREEDPEAGETKQVGDYLVAWLSGPGPASATTQRVFGEVYRLRSGYTLAFSGDR